MKWIYQNEPVKIHVMTMIQRKDFGAWIQYLFFSRLRSAPALGKVRAASHLRSPSPVFDLSFASCSVYSIKHSLSFVSLHFYILFSIYTIPTQKNYWGQAKPSVLPNDSLPIKTVFDLVWWVVVSLCNAIYVDVRNSIVKCKPLISYYIN